MKKTIAKTAALVMAAMLAGSACMPLTVSAYTAGASTTSDESKVEMQAALTTVKKRVKIPAELSEFEYSTSESYGTKMFNFTWHTPKDAKTYRSIQISIVGGIITSYSDSKNSGYTNDPSLAKLTEKEILEKAQAYAKQLNPSIVSNAKFELSSLELFASNARVSFKRYENNIPVKGNDGSIVLDKNTGALVSFSVDWWDNAQFPSPASAKSEKEIEAAYKKLCTLTPTYKISTNWETNNKTARIVYTPNMNSEIDAFTGGKSTIWEDMQKEEGIRYYGNSWYDCEEDCVAEEAMDAGGVDDVVFTPAELEKIQQDNNLIKTDKAFEMLKKDKFVALTDDYKLTSYDIYSVKDDKTEEETFYLSLNYYVKDELKKNYKGYKSINVKMNADTGEVLYLKKYDDNQTLPKLDVSKANSIAEAVTKDYSKNFIGHYKADSDNIAPVQSWKSGSKTVYEDTRTFSYSRYENDILVEGEYIYVTVDSKGTVTNYSFNYTEDVTFVPNKIIGSAKAFDKLYEQRDFDCYYDGWITKDGKVKTYLIYKMDNFLLNANTGALCSWNGEKLSAPSTPAREIKYTDIKGIPQEEAIRMLQKYGVTLSVDTETKQFKPYDIITEKEFENLISSALGGYAIAYDDVEMEEVEEDSKASAAAKKKAEAEEKDKAETTMEEAAVIFARRYLSADIAKLNGIFKSPFSDVTSGNKNVGYIAVANAKGFVKGENGKLVCEKKLTRAEAMQMVYDYIKSLSK